MPAGNGRTKPCNASGTAGGSYAEHTFTWQLGQALVARLQRLGATVVLTRPNDRGSGPCVNVRAAITNHDYKPVLNMWLRNIKDVYRIHRSELDLLGDDDRKTDRLTELNVMEQVFNLAKTSIVQRAWKHEQRPDLHGWVYGLNNGLIKPVFEMKAGTPIDDLFEYDDL